MSLRRAARHTSIYAAGIIAGKLASFVMLPVYTRFLTPKDYGILELLGMTIDVIGMLAGLSLVAGLFKFYSEAGDGDGRHAVAGTAAIGASALAAVTAAVGMLVSPLLTRVVLGPGVDPLYFRLFFAIYFLQNVGLVPMMLLRAQNRSVLFVVVNVGKLVLALSLNILFVVWFELGVRGVLTSSVIVESVVALGLGAHLVRTAGLRFSPARFAEMARFGTPLIVYSLSTFVLVFGDRFFLNYYVDTSSVGIYALAYKFAFVLSSLAYAPFGMFWEAQRFEVAKRPDAGRAFDRAFLYLNVVLGVTALGIALFVRDFLRVMASPAFVPAAEVVPLLLAAQILFTWVNQCDVGLVIRSKTGVIGTIGLVGAGATLLLNFLLIPWLGIHGAAWATLAAYGLRFVWVYRASQRHYFIPYRWSPVLRLFAILGGAWAVQRVLAPAGLAGSVALATLLMAAAAALVFVLVVEPDERSLVRGVLAAAVERVRRFRGAVPQVASPTGGA